MKLLSLVVVVACVGLVGGCGVQSLLLGSDGSQLLTVADALALPGEEVWLQARCQAGDFLKPQSGYVVKFYHDDRLIQSAETDAAGVASVPFTPTRPGDYRITVEVSAAGMAEKPPKNQDILIACRDARASLVVVDMDKTIVASGFQTVLLGDPTPMARSAEVLAELSKKHSIIYLTHRPDYFGIKSRAWLRDNDFPAGPLLLSSISGFLKGSGALEMALGLNQ